MSHTKGPWEYRDGYIYGALLEGPHDSDLPYMPQQKVIAKVVAGEDGNLLSAAPDLLAALRPLAAIADAYDANNLDDEARKSWGANSQHTNTRDPATIVLYAGRGGGTLLTLADCLAAREVVRKATGSPTT